MKRLLQAIVLVCIVEAPLTALAQSAQPYPSRPIKIIVPFPPGGTTDILARIVGQQMSTAWGQPVLIENKAGGGATIGADMVAKSPADGYTLLMGAAHHTIAQNVYTKLPYHFGKDFAPISVIAMVPNVIVVNANVPAQTIQEFVALAKSQPGKLNYGTAGAGTAHHMLGEMFKLKTDVDLVHVPYKGSAPAVADLVGGQIQVMFDTVTSGLPQIKAGKTRALAVTTSERSTALKNVPTLAETVIPGFNAGTWFGLLAPSGTPPAIIQKITEEIQKTVRSPSVRKQLLDMGAEPVGGSSEEMNSQIQSELATYGAVAKQIKLHVE
ncbi:tripartite tricarboxylate transporter substrate binding protein [Variovorax sp. OV700]|jgi:tripartite-type tricarboxylate transporter receptor subunit TctC|uniref:Bug family tripartite tricarboxylate transporter substrate binding protein n=1 Tax=Variovorax sp. OV700 TaxID=1882826 RepID=UPI00088E8C68|nr:tripartite tricarboxylate transporter substrate binding protein [Variovorax sp. OV700]SDJ17093.1 Tripartite-type tricarboxylate transporter, receptor component TctC [Variovorax sp. OV700]